MITALWIYKKKIKVIIHRYSNGVYEGQGSETWAVAMLFVWVKGDVTRNCNVRQSASANRQSAGEYSSALVYE